MRKTRRARLIAYGMAVLATAVSVLVRLLVVPEVMDERALYVSFIPAVMIAAYLGGLRPGLLATILSVVALDYFFIEPRYSFWIQTTVDDWVGLASFVLVGTLISGLCELLHRSRRRIVANERSYAVTLPSIGDAVIATDNQARVTFLNPVAEALTGWPQGDASGRLLTEVFHIINEQTRQPVEDPGAKVLRLGTVVGLANHTALVARDGREIPIDDCGAPIIDDRGGIRGVVLVFRDTTLRRQAETADAFRKSEQHWRSLTEALPQFIWTASADGTADYFSTQLTKYTGRTESELLAWGWMDLLHPDDRERTRNSWIEAIAKERNHEVEHRIRSSDGSYRWFTTRGVPIRDTAGHIVKWFGTCTDITEHKRSEQALRESEQRWRSLTEALPQLVWTATPDGACDYFSMQWTQFTGVLEIHLLGWQWMEVLHPDDREPTRQFWTNSVAGRGPYDVEYRVRRMDGEYRWFKTRGVPIRDSAGGIFKWFGTCTDITDGKLAAEELRLAKEAAESANRAKDEFLANVSHEIRTPMNAILGMTDLVLGTSLSDDQRQSLKTVKAAADNLLSILNDLLDFSKIEAGKLELDPADFGLRAALGDTLRTLAMRAHKKGLELVSHVQPDVPDALVGDAGRLRQVLLNLVGNAIKFTEEGEVVLTVKSEIRNPKSETNQKLEIPMTKASQTAVSELGHSDLEIVSDFGLRISDLGAGVTLRFAVRDTGIGVPHEKQAKIFRAFEQEDTSTTRKYGGTGLGLTIAARLVALMGGEISVDSEPGRGSTFTFTAQFGRQAHQPALNAAAPPIQLYNLPVLIIDDNATNCHILQEWLRSWQMEPVAVGDGVAAMDTLRDAVARGRPYPLVLLDARMPDTDGLVLAAKIRARPELSATRIILLTSGDMPSSVARLRELRIDAHLLKPAQQDELLETIYHVMRGGVRGEGRGMSEEASLSPDVNSAPAALAPRPSPLAARLHILVAEDNDFNAQLLEQLLVRRGHRVRLASDGRKALSLAGDGAFDLLLLDVHMPELDGFQVIQAIREREGAVGGHLPVVALTARSRKEDRDRCLAAGMDDFLAKPIQAPDLWAAIDRVVGARPPADRTGPGLLDPRVILAACGGDAVILENICRAFRTRLPEHLTAVQEALKERNTTRLREASHKLCGMVAAFSSVAGGVASHVEDLAAQGQLDDARSLVGQLETMAEELVRLTTNLSLETLRPQSVVAE